MVHNSALQPVQGDSDLAKYIDGLIVSHIVRPPNEKEYIKELNEQRMGKIYGRGEKRPSYKSFVGMPITLEYKDVNTLLSKKEGFDYSLTQKVDGQRMAMFIGGGVKHGGREIVFIDRSWNYYKIKNGDEAALPLIGPSVPTMPEMILDGEMVFFDAAGNPHKQLDGTQVKAISYMAFDMLYGPSEVSTIRELGIAPILKLGQSSSMVIPITGKSILVNAKDWSYKRRYDVLYNLIFPNELNNYRAFLPEAIIKEVKWFMVEVKPISPLDKVKEWANIYSESGLGKSQTKLSEFRKDFYTKVGGAGVFTKKNLNLDGLIFTSNYTLYTIGAWNRPGTTQYKWKPEKEQSVDFLMMKKEGTGVGLYIGDREKNWQFIPPKEMSGKEQVHAASKMEKGDFATFNDYDIGEFNVTLKGGSFVYTFMNLRQDKKSSNAKRTADNVLLSVVNPVDINRLSFLLNLIDKPLDSGTKKKRDMENRALLKNMDKISLIKCATSKGRVFISDKDFLFIEKTIDKYPSPDIELEFRIGKMVGPGGFNADLGFNEHINANVIMAEKRWEHKKYDYIDVVGEESKRQRYMRLGKTRSYVLKEYIIKGRVENKSISFPTVDGEKMFPYDIRFSVASEKIQDVTVNKFVKVKVIKKERDTYFHPKGVFVIDITKITFGGDFNKEGRSYVPGKAEDEKYQIEVEILRKDPLYITDMIQLLQELSGAI